jgi:hypothetical protein
MASQAEQRLVALDRGRRVARAAESVRTMRKTPIEEGRITLTKTLRDNHEAAKLLNRIEDARTERLLMEVGKPNA